MKRKPVASFDTRAGFGISDVIRWGDTMTINNTEIDIAKAVELGKEKGIDLAEKLERDLKSDTGLLITFPIAFLMDKLQRLPEIGTGEALLALVKPDDEQ